MKALRLRKPGGLQHLTVEDIDFPRPPGPGEISVRLHASSLNYHDYLVATGVLPVDDGRVLMSDGAGVVVSVGAGVKAFAPGESVMSTFYPNWQDGSPEAELLTMIPGDRQDGFACEQVVRDATAFVHAPRGYSHVQAATLPCAGLTAWRALIVEGRIKPGDVVVVQGTGGVSIFALQIAKMAGATVIATSSSNAKLERLKALGADHMINYRETPAWGAMARALTGGKGVDHVVEVGGAGTLPQSIAAVRNGGHIAMIGVLAGFSGEVPTHEIRAKEIRMIGITVGNVRQLREMSRALGTREIRPVTDRSFRLEALADAFAYQETGEHFGKIVVEW